MIVPFEVRQFTVGEVTLSYEVYGSGPRVLVYLHGLLLDAHANRRLARDLAEAGNRVVLLDLPGHGNSDKPRRASSHRMDAYARCVVALLDELGVDQAVVGGFSLGADVTLQVARLAPERVRGMVIEMPVLEQATPVAALVFVPLLTLTHYASAVFRAAGHLARRIPRRAYGPFEPFVGPLMMEPEEITAVLHGVLVGPVAPTVEERRALTMPAIVIGHRSDRLHPFGDASRLVSDLPHGTLLEANHIWELRFTPRRITQHLAEFLAGVWGVAGDGDTSASPSASSSTG